MFIVPKRGTFALRQEGNVYSTEPRHARPPPGGRCLIDKLPHNALMLRTLRSLSVCPAVRPDIVLSCDLQSTN